MLSNKQQEIILFFSQSTSVSGLQALISCRTNWRSDNFINIIKQTIQNNKFLKVVYQINMAEQLRETLVINQILKCGLDIFNLNGQNLNGQQIINQRDPYDITDQISFTLSSEEHVDQRKQRSSMRRSTSIQKQPIGNNNSNKKKKLFKTPMDKIQKLHNQNIYLPKKDSLGHQSLYKQLYLSSQKKQQTHDKTDFQQKSTIEKYEIKTPQKTFQKKDIHFYHEDKSIVTNLFQKPFPLSAIKNQPNKKIVTPYSQKIIKNVYGKIKTELSSFTVSNSIEQLVNNEQKKQKVMNKQKKWEQFLMRDKQWRQRRNSNVMFKKVEINMKIDKETKTAAEKSLHNKHSRQKTSKSRLQVNKIENVLLSKSIINNKSGQSSVQICLNKLKVQTQFLKVKLLQHPDFKQQSFSSKKDKNQKKSIQKINKNIITISQNQTKRLVRSFIDKSQNDKQKQRQSQKHIKQNKEVERYLGKNRKN